MGSSRLWKGSRRRAEDAEGRREEEPHPPAQAPEPAREPLPPPEEEEEEEERERSSSNEPTAPKTQVVEHVDPSESPEDRMFRRWEESVRGHLHKKQDALLAKDVVGRNDQALERFMRFASKQTDSTWLSCVPNWRYGIANPLSWGVSTKMTVAHHACYEGNEGLVLYLIGNGANFSAKTTHGNKPLEMFQSDTSSKVFVNKARNLLSLLALASATHSRLGRRSAARWRRFPNDLWIVVRKMLQA
jgi:hypothetical protein